MIIQSGSKTALKIGGKAVSYSELIQKTHFVSEKIANKQGRVVIYSENREAWAYAFLATWNVGMIPVPVDFMSVAADVQYVLNDCKPSVIFCSAKCLPVLEKALQGTTFSPEIILLDSLEEPTTKQYPTELNLGSNSEETAVIIYTSGTTGKSKGVMLSFRNLQANIDAVCSEVGIFTPDDKVLMLLPLHHILPLMGTLLMPLSVGCTIAMSPSMASEDIVRTLKENKVSIIIGVPRLYAAIRKGIMDKVAKSLVAKILFAIAKNVDSFKFSRFVFGSVHKKFGGSVKYMVSGGAALDTAVYEDFRTLGFEILEGYGMSEAAPMISFNHPGKTKKGSAGIPLSCVKTEIRDNEIVVSGPNVMQGYFEKPDETSEVIKDGWLYTGDLGHLDENGFIYITGRKKEIMVLSNGKKINPSEIEEQLEAISPVIKEAGVFQDGDRIRAIIVPDNIKKQELQIDDIEKYLLKEVIQAYNHSVVPYKMIMQITVSEKELPRTRLGKIQRFLLPSMAVEQTQQEEPQEDVKLEEYVMLKDFIKQEKKIDVKPNDHLIMNIGLDSLERVGLQVFIETSFGISIEMEQLTRFENILALSQYLHEHKKHTSIEFVNWSNILKQKIHLKLPSTWITSNIMVKMSHVFFKVFFRYKARGAYHIPQGPCIIVANHQSFLDGLFVAAHLKYSQMRKTFFYAKEKHVSNSFLKFLANRNNIIVMDLNNNLKESIQKMAEVLKTQKNLIIFPEGTRTKDGSLGDFKKNLCHPQL